MRALIIFFSVTGTTERVASSIAEGLRDAGVDVATHDIRDGPAPSAAAFEIVGVGFPVHWFRMPEPVRDAIAHLGDLTGHSAFAFSLNATYGGAGLNRARAALARTGAREIGVFSCRGEGHFHGYSILGYQFSPGHPDEADLAAAREFGLGLVGAHAAAQRGLAATTVPRDPLTHWVYALERTAAAPWLARVFYSRYFTLDVGRCTRCGRCARICPSHNIAWEKGRLPVWGRDCVLCLMCAEVCPETAVTCPIDWPLFRPFLKYNVRRAARDPELEHARIELRRGRAVPLEDRGSEQKG